jgi:hypothetical protein
MQSDQEWLATAALNTQLITATVLRAVASSPKLFSDEADLELAIASTTDGILGALAWMLESTGNYPKLRDKRKVADQCREGLIKFMKVADRDIEAGEDWAIGPEGKPN